ncbi:MAG TPA: response regulator transcription factor [Gammaproteobacteria bacterium]|nr:response regulator transcription factor [Gammaproteobacteria bacterium]
MRLLLVEDEPRLAARLREQLSAQGYAVDVASDGIDAEFQGLEVDYDLIVLDLGLPGRPGLEVLAHWRAQGMRAPVLILTARDGWQERVVGLKAGADDYLGKPFHVEELIARLQAILRRAHGEAAPQLTVGDLVLDEDQRTVSVAGAAPQSLTATEFRLLRCFMLNPDKVLSKSFLTEHVYDQDFDRDSNLIEVYVRRLRERIGEARIATRRGHGYVFVPAAR